MGAGLICLGAACSDEFGDSNPASGLANRNASPTTQDAAGAPGPTGPGPTMTPTTNNPDQAEPVLPPEVEMELSFERPQGSERYVYAANPEAGTVVIIHAETRTIQTIETGRDPTFLRTLAGSDDAIVLNIGDDEATLLRGPKDPGSAPATRNLPVVAGANAIEVAPDGRHAVVYHDAERATGEGGFGDFQAVTVLTLTDDKAEANDMSVGFKPRKVAFKADSSEAYVVTESGISVLNFASIEDKGSGIAEGILFNTGSGEQSQDVSITPDGHYAVARQPGLSSLTLVDLENGETRSLDLAEVYEPPVDPTELDEDAGMPMGVTTLDVSDLDIAPSGKHAVAVLRDRSAVMRIAIPSGFDDPSAIETRHVEGAVIGQAEVVPNSDRVLLFTTAVESERMAILDLGTDAPALVVDLRKLVQAVAVSDDGGTALIVHRPKPGNPFEPGISFEEQLDRSFGYTLLRPSTGFTRLARTEVPPGPFLIVPSNDFLFLTFRGDAQQIREAHRIVIDTFLVDDTILLGSPPVSVGVVPDSKQVFISQEHPDGRMTFVQWETGEKNQITGFELNSRIRD